MQKEGGHKKIKAKIYELENKYEIERINKYSSWFYKRTDKIDKLSQNIWEKKNEKAQISHTRKQKRHVIMDRVKMKNKNILRTTTIKKFHKTKRDR